MNDIKDAFIELANAKYSDRQDKLKEYIREGEHQDGYEYWDQFDTPMEALEDFELYLQILDEEGL